MATDWGALEEEFSSNFKDYAPAGRYTVKVTGVLHHEVGSNGSIAQDFTIEESDEYAFPKVTHWLSFKNDGWRKIHNKRLMMFFGADEKAAEKAVDVCEDKGSRDNIISAYQQTYERLLAKKPEVEIETWPDGKYSRADFTDNKVRMSRPDDDRKPAATEDSILDQAEPLSGNEDLNLPF